MLFSVWSKFVVAVAVYSSTSAPNVLRKSFYRVPAQQVRGVGAGRGGRQAGAVVPARAAAVTRDQTQWDGGFVPE